MIFMQIAAISGKIETQNNQCLVDNQVIDCPKQTFFGGEMSDGTALDLLPSNFLPEVRSDPIFYGLLSAVLVVFALLAIFKSKIFGKTLAEYLKPIWYYIIVCLAVVAWQYLVGVNGNAGRLPLRISQWIWELAIALSAIQLVRKNNFGFANIFFLGVLYSLIIHGLKVTIRYAFYGKSLLYVLDRFLYGSLLVMIIICAIGWAALSMTKNKKGGNNENQTQ